MATYKTPGVYIEEISTLPPSVVEVATAIPAFIGYTEKTEKTEKGPRQVARIDSMLEYKQLFGEPQVTDYKVSTKVDPTTRQRVLSKITPTDGQSNFLMYYCLSHYFNNGGGSCYVISVGGYSDPKTAQDFENGLDLLEKEDEPTLVLLTDAVSLDTDSYYKVCVKALALCAKLGDRFAILDVKDGDVTAFRGNTGTDSLKYGAAYHPYLQTSLVHHHDSKKVKIEEGANTSPWRLEFDAIAVTYQGDQSAPKVTIVKGSDDKTTFVVADDLLAIKNVDGATGEAVAAAWTTWAAKNDQGGFTVEAMDKTAAVDHTNNRNVLLTGGGTATQTLNSMADSGTVLVSQIKTALNAQRVTLPPSAAMAGIYARVDRERGVWKAPANVSVSSTIGPVDKITNQKQDDLNVDDNGKSINGIREFAGKGTVVWGARTLAGNSNEWRYVPVRRLFNMIEESTRKASSFAVFEPNDANTWLKVKGMIDSFLYGLWERGALAGPTPESAYVVNVGLGKTMTTQDVLDGRMIVEIGVAAVRPAEFIVVRFTHKMQEA